MKAAPLLLGLAATAVLTAEAEGCSLAPRQPERPFYAQLVRSSAYIDIFEVVGVEQVEQPTNASRRSQNTRISFRLVRSIKGDETPELSFEIFDPDRNFDRDVGEASDLDDVWTNPFSDEPSDHSELSFWMGQDAYDVSVDPACNVVYPPFQPGDRYLVFRDQNGEPASMWDTFGLSFVWLESEDDLFLEAIERLHADPSLDYGRSMSAREFVELLPAAALIEQYQCEDEAMQLRMIPLGDGFEQHDYETDYESVDRNVNFWSPQPFFDGNDRCWSEQRGWWSCDPAPTGCERVTRVFGFPAKTFPFANGVGGTHYGELGVPISDNDEVMFDQTVEFSEFEITGNVHPALTDVISWFEAAHD